MKKKSNERAEIIVLQTLLTNYLLIEQLDELATVPCFRHSLKQKANLLMKELEAHVDLGIGKALEVNDTLTFELIDQRKKIVKLFAILSEEEINELALFLNNIVNKRVLKIQKDVESAIKNHQQ